MIATRMFCEFRIVRKLTAPPLTNGTAITKKRIIRARKSQAQMRLSNSASRCDDARSPEGPATARSATLDPRSVTFPRKCGEWMGMEKSGAPVGGAPDHSDRAGLLARNLVDEPSHCRIFDVVLVDDRKAGLDAARKTGDAGRVGHGKLHRHIAHVERLLRQHQADHAFVH